MPARFVELDRQTPMFLPYGTCGTLQYCISTVALHPSSFLMPNNYSLTSMKKGAAAKRLIVNGGPYAEIQKRLASELAIHINNNPVSQEIEEVSIRWKAPIDREYCYIVKSS
jgi:hypothetical protein